MANHKFVDNFGYCWCGAPEDGLQHEPNPTDEWSVWAMPIILKHLGLTGTYPKLTEVLRAIKDLKKKS